MTRIAVLCRVLGTMLIGLGSAVAQGDPDAIAVRVEEPRAFGHQVGDLLTRRIVIDVPGRLKLDETSLPTPGRVGQSFELRAVEHRQRRGWNGTRHVVLLRYQVFRAVDQPRVLDLPSFVLRFAGQPRAEEWRIDYAPVGIVPVAPVEPVLRQGLGALRPDVPPLFVDTRGERLRLAVYAMVATALLAHLSYVVWGWGWWQRRQRPFSLALRRLRDLQAARAPGASQEAWRVTHAALDATAGRVMDAASIEHFLAMSPRHAPLADELRWFFARSQAVFFAGAASGEADTERLLALCRRGQAIERGLA